MPRILVALRTDKAFTGVKAFLDSKAAGGFAVREVAGENEHWHWLVETEYKNIQTFRVNLVRAVPELKGNASYSATEVKDLEKYERYMAKGASEGEMPEVAWRNSIVYTDDRIGELHEQYWTENRRLRKRKAGTAMDATVDICKDESVDWKDRAKISEIYLRQLVQRNRPVNTFAARAAVNTIQVQLCPDDQALKMFAEQL